jgi:hypothetical protein
MAVGISGEIVGLACDAEMRARACDSMTGLIYDFRAVSSATRVTGRIGVQLGADATNVVGSEARARAAARELASSRYAANHSRALIGIADLGKMPGLTRKHNWVIGPLHDTSRGAALVQASDIPGAVALGPNERALGQQVGSAWTALGLGGSAADLPVYSGTDVSSWAQVRSAGALTEVLDPSQDEVFHVARDTPSGVVDTEGSRIADPRYTKDELSPLAQPDGVIRAGLLKKG